MPATTPAHGPTTAAAPSFQPSRALAGAGLLAAVGAAQLGLVAVTGHGVACPLRAMTGLLCPLCGTTTATVALLQGHWLAAWQANPFSLVLLGVLAPCVLAWCLELAGGPALRPPARLRPCTLDRLLLAVAPVALAFMVWRNLA